jgi:3-hydroxyacyl-CoA dehydrogenase
MKHIGVVGCGTMGAGIVEVILAVWKSMQESAIGPGMGLTAENLAEK